jgi:hypothetical protein
MPWVVGIDEAGYGPNLGPLVQAAVALRLPDGDPAGWTTLKGVVRRCGERAKKGDERLLIDDSKKVYARGGFEALERGAMTVAPVSTSVGELVHKACLKGCPGEVAAEAWFDPAERVPATAAPESLFGESAGLGDRAAEQTLRARVGSVFASVVPAPQFNHIIGVADSKGVVLALGLTDLLAATLAALPADDAEPLVCVGDKLGGRNFYAAILQRAFPAGWVVIEKESAEESRYRVEHLDRPVAVTFRPRADGDSVSVALASMLCKYLREVCMRQFNRFWATHVPGIAPTAGYPVDAKRFYAEIKPAMAKLGLADDQVWRKK